MVALSVQNLFKHFDGVKAVDDLSFEVRTGEIFGLLGPNGAGKTTTIRIAVNIFKPDSGTVTVLGQSPGNAQARVGYLPEERGLYRNLKVQDVPTYLAELKGLPHAVALERTRTWLERVELGDWAKRKVKDLSRGMQQKLQFVVSVVHDPELLILDEPFQGLDPVNVELIKSLIRELRNRGTTVLLSTHQMNLVEALCDRIVLIDRGRAVLYGSLQEIKRRFASNTVQVQTPAHLVDLEGVAKIEAHDHTYTLTLANGVTPQALLRTLVEREIPVEAFWVANVPLEQIFIAVVEGPVPSQGAERQLQPVVTA